MDKHQSKTAFSFRNKVLIALVILVPVIGLGILAAVRGLSQKPLDDLGEVPAFTLTNQDGSEIKRESFRGTVWVAAFIFTHCDAQCPLIVQTLKKVSDDVSEGKWKIVGISLDPLRDTPEQLQHFSAHHELKAERWTLLTGPADLIQNLIADGFRVSGRVNEGTHTAYLVLVDRDAHIRGYYDSNDAQRIDRLKQDLRRLMKP